MCGSHNTRPAMHIHANISAFAKGWLPCVQPHAHSHRIAFWPLIGSEGALCSGSRRQRIPGTTEGYKEGITLRVHLVPMPLPEGISHQLPVGFEHMGIMLS